MKPLRALIGKNNAKSFSAEKWEWYILCPITTFSQLYWNRKYGKTKYTIGLIGDDKIYLLSPEDIPEFKKDIKWDDNDNCLLRIKKKMSPNDIWKRCVGQTMKEVLDEIPEFEEAEI